MSQRQPDWDVDLARGEEAEKLYRNLREMIANGTAEVKRDDRALETGNVYIEHECLTAGGWQPSGIQVTKATTWVIVFWPVMLALPSWIVRNIWQASLDNGGGVECSTGSHPTKGALVPVRDLLPSAVAMAAAPLTAERQAA